MTKKDKVRSMFDDIAGDYDRLNHVMSLDVDKIWRRRAVHMVVEERKEADILDLACGTGDSSIALAEKLTKGRVTGVDLSEGMLAVMREKVEKKGLGDRISIELGDGENLRFDDGSFDRVTICFGLRNYEDVEKGLREMLRVLKPGGRALILELSQPENPIIKWIYDIYFLHILPRIGGKGSGNLAAYRYLPASVVAFPHRREFMGMMSEAGFAKVGHKALSLGLCRMYVGEKPNCN